LKCKWLYINKTTYINAYWGSGPEIPGYTVNIKTKTSPVRHIPGG